VWFCKCDLFFKYVLFCIDCYLCFALIN
jgi:hypothetical protein